MLFLTCILERTVPFLFVGVKNTKKSENKNAKRKLKRVFEHLKKYIPPLLELSATKAEKKTDSFSKKEKSFYTKLDLKNSCFIKH